MKIKEMRKICHDHKGICKGCPLNIENNWMEKYGNWCLIIIREDYIKKYQKYSNEGNINLAEKSIQEYKEIERQQGITQ